MMKIAIVLGTRPEIIKLAPIIGSLPSYSNVEMTIVHTGQHYDKELSENLIEEIDLPPINEFLAVGSGTHGRQTACMIYSLESCFERNEPDLVLAEGDTNTVAAAGIVTANMRIHFGHVEAGLRSYDRTMPEEINRVLADDCANICFAPTELSALNLLYEGIPPSRIYITGNTIVDMSIQYRKIAEERSRILENIGSVDTSRLVTLTLHRPRNTDNRYRLKQIVSALLALDDYYFVFPVHPRSRKKMISFGLWKKLVAAKNIFLSEPLGYLDFLKLLSNSCLVVTDSGGVQEEAFTLKIPCMTLRERTERPETLISGANRLVDTEVKAIVQAIENVAADMKLRRVLEGIPNVLGDGRSGERIARISVEKCEEARVKEPILLESGAERYILSRVDERLEKLTVEQFEEYFHALKITLIYNEKGQCIFPKRDLTLRKNWFIRVFGCQERMRTLTRKTQGLVSHRVRRFE